MNLVRSFRDVRSGNASKLGAAAPAGALVPGFWGIPGFILFGSRESFWTRAFWDAVYLTCPVWVINTPYDVVFMPLLNAGVYFLAMSAILAVRG